MGWETCVQCGRSFDSSKDDGILGASYEFIGNNWYCSVKCRRKYKSAKREQRAELLKGDDDQAETNQAEPKQAAADTKKTRGSSGGGLGLGGLMKDAMTGNLAPKDEKKGELNDIADIQFSEDMAEIENILNQLVTKAQGAKGGGISPIGMTSNKQIRAAIKEKMEFGIMKLRSGGKTAEADFFEKKLKKIK